MKKELLIVNAVAMQSVATGDYVYRVEQPAAALGKLPETAVITVSTISPFFGKLCLQADVLVLHLLTEEDLLPVIEERKRRGLATVFEMSDNILAPHPGVGRRGWFSDPLHTASALQYAGLADAMQVTGEGLKKMFGFLNPHTAVLENQVARLGAPRAAGSGRVRIGWAGSVGHTEDLFSFREAVAAAMAENPALEFAFMGNAGQFEQLFSRLPGGRASYRPAGALSDYLEFLDGLDAGIAPLLETPYNLCRSDVKFIEYASRGAVPVLSSILPYQIHGRHCENALLFSTPGELASILEVLARDSGLRQKISLGAFDYASRNRMEDQHARPRREFYAGLRCAEVPRDLSGVPLAACEGSRSFNVTRTEAELLLIRGIEAEAQGDAQTARDIYAEAERAAEGYYLPAFRLGHSLAREGSPEAAGHFERAARKNPRSIRSLRCLGDALRDRDREAAVAAYRSALNVSAAHAPSFEAIASLCEKEGEWERAAELYQCALRANPYSSRAALGIGNICRRTGLSGEANKFFEAAAEMAPNFQEAQIAYAEFLAGTGKEKEAVPYCIRGLEIDPSWEPAVSLAERILDKNDGKKLK